MKKLHPSWNPKDSIYEVLENKEFQAVGFRLDDLKVPIFTCLNDIYFTLKEGHQQEALMMLDLLGAWLQSKTTPEASKRYNELRVIAAMADIDEELEKILTDDV
jgi:hypothetical protein